MSLDCKLIYNAHIYSIIAKANWHFLKKKSKEEHKLVSHIAIIRERMVCGTIVKGRNVRKRIVWGRIVSGVNVGGRTVWISNKLYMRVDSHSFKIHIVFFCYNRHVYKAVHLEKSTSFKLSLLYQIYRLKFLYILL